MLVAGMATAMVDIGTVIMVATRATIMDIMVAIMAVSGMAHAQA